MNRIELTKKILEWESKKKELDILQTEIEKEIKELKETYKAGNTVAKFVSGRRKFNYEIVGQHAPIDIIDDNTRLEEKIDWKKVCSDAGITEIPFEKGEDSVVINIVTESEDVRKEFSEDDYIKSVSDLPF
jgi:hypothetical protein